MQPHSYISDFEQLRKWFEAQKCPKWNLYRGFHERMPERSIIYKQREDQLTSEESWALLQDMITMNGNGGGKFTIFLPAYGAAKGPSVFFGLHLQGVSMAPGISGLPGQRSPSMVPAMGYVSPEDVERRVTEALEKERLHRKIEDLESAIGAKQTWQDVLFEKVLQLDPDKAMNMLGNFLGNAFQPPATSQVQVRGLKQEEIPEEEASTTAEYDGDRLVAILDRLLPHFTDETDLLNFLDEVATRFCSNPSFYRGLIEGNG